MQINGAHIQKHVTQTPLWQENILFTALLRQDKETHDKEKDTIVQKLTIIRQEISIDPGKDKLLLFIQRTLLKKQRKVETYDHIWKGHFNFCKHDFTIICSAQVNLRKVHRRNKLIMCNTEQPKKLIRKVWKHNFTSISVKGVW